MSRGGMFGRTPGVYIQDPSTPSAQFITPLLRSLVGPLLAGLMAGSGAAWFVWLIPPASAVFFAAVTLATGFVAIGGLGLVARLDETRAIEAGDENRVRFYMNRQLLAFIACIGLAALFWGVGRMPKTWWGLPERTWQTVTENLGLYTFQFIFSTALIGSGVLMIYYFVKETIRPHELAGDNLVAKLKLDFDREKYYDQRAWVQERANLLQQVKGLEHDLLAANSRPLINAAEVSNHQRQPILWLLALTQMIAIAEMDAIINHTQGTWCPGGATRYTLPLTNTPVTDKLVKYVYRCLRTTRIGDEAVMLSQGNKTFPNPRVPTLLFIEALSRVPQWEGFE